MLQIAEKTLAEIVAGNHRAVNVFEKYHLDFCCKGKRTLAAACHEKSIFLEQVLQELSLVMVAPAAPETNSMLSAEKLISHILLRHHFYVRQSMPVIEEHLTRVATKHGDRFPFMVQVLHIFMQVQTDMTQHMHKEEHILFPRIKEVEQAQLNSSKALLDAAYVTAPIAVMEHEHDAVGEMLYRIREITNNYTAAEGACTTHRVALAWLKEFEEDLHRHVHLENNLLFPLAAQMLQEVVA